ncbi:MAG: response regulator [Candidatus Heimdallarchaeota archaeon]|nr:MAG: response regulator [Candidatus Heimdallarchaeota archaeon]
MEDDEALLEHSKLILENHEYKILTAKNGVEALEILETNDQLPDLILCDIMMPEMNGYEFFNKMIDNPDWNLIPFIFLTVKDSPEDVRFGKMLGADDYLAKPVNELDLLASIAGKINRGRKHNLWSKQIRSHLLTDQQVEISSDKIEEKKTVIVFLVVWDDKIGPYLKLVYPKNAKLPISVESIGIQLFQAAGPMYGTIDYYAAQGVLFRVANIDMDSYLYFSTIDDEDARGGKRQIMIAALAQRINYFESIRISEILEDFFVENIEVQEDNIKDLWERIGEIMTSM